MNKSEILEYARTVFIALIAAMIIAAGATCFSNVIAEHHYKLASKIQNKEQDNQMIGFLISKYEKELQKDSSNYVLNSRLGELYELLFSYEQAEKNYQLAIEKAPYGVYSPYIGLARMYIKTDKLDKAQITIKKLKNIDHKPLLIEKGNFYMELGDAFWKKSSYIAALKQYKLALFFYKKVDSEKAELAITGILDCYSRLASKHFMEGKLTEAVHDLETALIYKNTPVLNYKLALLNQDIDAFEAVKYIEKTYAVDPGIINYDLYEQILIKAIKQAQALNMYTEAKLYYQKYKMIKQFKKRYIFTDKDYGIEIDSHKLKTNIFGNKKTIDVKFRVKNKTKESLNTLFVVVEAKYNDKTDIVYNEVLFSKKNPLKPLATSDTLHFILKFDDEKDIINTKNIVFNFNISKKQNMRKFTIFSFEMHK